MLPLWRLMHLLSSRELQDVSSEKTMELSPSREDAICAEIEELPNILRNSKILQFSNMTAIAT
jgi:hypothetical protein